MTSSTGIRQYGKCRLLGIIGKSVLYLNLDIVYIYVRHAQQYCTVIFLQSLAHFIAKFRRLIDCIYPFNTVKFSSLLSYHFKKIYVVDRVKFWACRHPCFVLECALVQSRSALRNGH